MTKFQLFTMLVSETEIPVTINGVTGYFDSIGRSVLNPGKDFLVKLWKPSLYGTGGKLVQVGVSTID